MKNIYRPSINFTVFVFKIFCKSNRIYHTYYIINNFSFFELHFLCILNNKSFQLLPFFFFNFWYFFRKKENFLPILRIKIKQIITIMYFFSLLLLCRYFCLIIILINPTYYVFLILFSYVFLNLNNLIDFLKKILNKFLWNYPSFNLIFLKYSVVNR